MDRGEELRDQAQDASQRAAKATSHEEGRVQRKRRRALSDLANTEDWLDGKPSQAPE